MAKRKKPKPNISDWLALNWEEQDPEEPEVATNCDFCNGDIKTTEHYFYGTIPHGQEAGYCVFTACARCVTAAGIKW